MWKGTKRCWWFFGCKEAGGLGRCGLLGGSGTEAVELDQLLDGEGFGAVRGRDAGGPVSLAPEHGPQLLAAFFEELLAEVGEGRTSLVRGVSRLVRAIMALVMSGRGQKHSGGRLAMSLMVAVTWAMT